MEQLSWTDDMMLRAERPETPIQIQMLLIYDQSTAPGGKVTFKRILEEIDARLVVCGQRGRGPIGSALLGSVSHALAAHTKRPVLIAPQHPS